MPTLSNFRGAQQLLGRETIDDRRALIVEVTANSGGSEAAEDPNEIALDILLAALTPEAKLKLIRDRCKGRGGWWP